MLYEISNKVSNHKYTEKELKYKHPFSRFIGRGKNKVRRTCYLIPDDPFVMCEAYKYGFSMKPHAFQLDGKKETQQPWVHCIVLDFDNLTKEQCQFVMSKVDDVRIFGDWSSGMKTTINANRGIPNGISKWKYKVFFPTLEPTLCVYEDVDRAFRDAVAFFNPTFPMDDVNRIWKAWKKANNRKNMICDPMFKDWILPDVQMLNAFRTQVTFSINTNLKEPFVELDDDDSTFRRLGCISKYPVTSKYDYEGLDWKLEEAKPEVEVKNKPTESEIDEIYHHLSSNCCFSYSDYSLPTSKAAFARKLRLSHIDDLVLPTSGIARINAARWSQIHDRCMNTNFDKEEMMKDANLVSKTFARIYAELRLQGETGNFKVQALEDCCTAMKFLHGPKLFDNDGYLKPEDKEELLQKMARAFMYAWKSYKWWRIRQKLFKTVVNDGVLELRRVWRESRSNEDYKAYCIELNKDIEARYEEAKKIEFPYDYHRKGFKMELIDQILVPGHVKLNDPKEFIEKMRQNINVKKDGQYSDKILTSWFYEYRKKFNDTYPDDQIGRKQHSSKYSDMFNGKSQDEISDIISKLEIHTNMKSRLRKQYGVEIRKR